MNLACSFFDVGIVTAVMIGKLNRAGKHQLAAVNPVTFRHFPQEFRNPAVMVGRTVLFIKLFFAGAVCLMADAPDIHLRSAVNFRQGFREDGAFHILLSVSQHLLKLFDRDFRDRLFITRKNLCNKVIPDFRQRCVRVSNLPSSVSFS